MLTFLRKYHFSWENEFFAMNQLNYWKNYSLDEIFVKIGRPSPTPPPLRAVWKRSNSQGKNWRRCNWHECCSGQRLHQSEEESGWWAAVPRPLPRMVELVLKLVEVHERTGVLQSQRVWALGGGRADVGIVTGRWRPKRCSPANWGHHRVAASIHELKRKGLHKRNHQN